MQASLSTGRADAACSAACSQPGRSGYRGLWGWCLGGAWAHLCAAKAAKAPTAGERLRHQTQAPDSGSWPVLGAHCRHGTRRPSRWLHRAGCTASGTGLHRAAQVRRAWFAKGAQPLARSRQRHRPRRRFLCGDREGKVGKVEKKQDQRNKTLTIEKLSTPKAKEY